MIYISYLAYNMNNCYTWWYSLEIHVRVSFSFPLLKYKTINMLWAIYMLTVIASFSFFGLAVMPKLRKRRPAVQKKKKKKNQSGPSFQFPVPAYRSIGRISTTSNQSISITVVYVFRFQNRSISRCAHAAWRWSTREHISCRHVNLEKRSRLYIVVVQLHAWREYIYYSLYIKVYIYVVYISI